MTNVASQLISVHLHSWKVSDVAFVMLVVTKLAPTSYISSNVGDQMLTSIPLNPLVDVATVFKLLTSASSTCVAAA